MDKLLTDAELGIMDTLWMLEQGTVREVHGALARDVAYTTVATLLKILAHKGFVSAEKNGRALVYRPAVERSAYQQTGLAHLVKRVFGGDPMALVRTLVSSNDLSDDDLAALEQMVDATRDDA